MQGRSISQTDDSYDYQQPLYDEDDQAVDTYQDYTPTGN